MLDIQGKGDMDGSFENSRARVKMRANKYQKDGQTYIKFDTFNLKIQIGKNKLNLKNLFNGDPTLGSIGNNFINENSELFLSGDFSLKSVPFNNLMIIYPFRNHTGIGEKSRRNIHKNCKWDCRERQFWWNVSRHSSLAF